MRPLIAVELGVIGFPIYPFKNTAYIASAIKYGFIFEASKIALTANMIPVGMGRRFENRNYKACFAKNTKISS
jgi:hypothetical protein